MLLKSVSIDYYWTTCCPLYVLKYSNVQIFTFFNIYDYFSNIFFIVIFKCFFLLYDCYNILKKMYAHNKIPMYIKTISSINYYKYSKPFHCISENATWLCFGCLTASLLRQLGAYICILWAAEWDRDIRSNAQRGCEKLKTLAHIFTHFIKSLYTCKQDIDKAIWMLVTIKTSIKEVSA